MFTQMKDHLAKQLAEIKANGLYKVERTIITPQSSAIRIAERSGSVEFLCQQLPRTIRQSPAHFRREKGDGFPRIRHVVGTVHLRGARPAPRA